jgi:tRNA-splicing ligase RtcB
MRQVVSTEKVPIKMWLEDMEEGALEQARNLANLPFVFKHVAIMPDSHQGYGMPIGGVIATKGVIIPNAVGVDIGCGMCALKTSRKSINTNSLKRIMGKIREAVPVGFNKHPRRQDAELMPKVEGKEITKEEYPIISREFGNALKSLGTLGGGNHFIEIQKGDDGHVWIMIHSGSRNLGLKVAEHYNKLAIQLNERWHSVIPKHWQLAFLPIETQEGKSYIREMKYCVEYALANRKLMMDRIKEIFIEESSALVEFDEMINIAHNYAVYENHFGSNVIVHRKGATKATPGLLGIIPGSQGTKSYIVEGKGNPESFMSCSHGAGRLMSRKKAENTLDLQKEISILDKKGIIHGIRSKKDLDEAPSAYKNIDMVMDCQTDLVDIKVKLSPLAVIKG